MGRTCTTATGLRSERDLIDRPPSATTEPGPVSVNTRSTHSRPDAPKRAVAQQVPANPPWLNTPHVFLKRLHHHRHHHHRPRLVQLPPRGGDQERFSSHMDDVCCTSARNVDEHQALTNATTHEHDESWATALQITPAKRTVCSATPLEKTGTRKRRGGRTAVSTSTCEPNES